MTSSFGPAVLWHVPAVVATRRLFSGVVLSPHVSQKMAGPIGKTAERARYVELTRQGLSNAEICRQLRIHRKTAVVGVMVAVIAIQPARCVPIRRWPKSVHPRIGPVPDCPVRA